MTERACVKCRSTRIVEIAKRRPKMSWSEYLNTPGVGVFHGTFSRAKPKHKCDFCQGSKYPFYRCPDCNATLCKNCTPKVEPKPANTEPTPPPLSADDRTKIAIEKPKKKYAQRCEMIDGMVADGTLDNGEPNGAEAEAMKDKAKQQMIKEIDRIMG